MFIYLFLLRLFLPCVFWLLRGKEIPRTFFSHEWEQEFDFLVVTIHV